ncbi:MAG: DUF896 domain-containing protein [Thomasclavelia sp.]|nr:DUF896 domain-containing protein [Thomasclavelia sp.]
MAIDKKLINRINELSKKKKEGTLTKEELSEQKLLREEYLKAFRKGFKERLETVEVVDSKGNNVTPKKKIKVN